MPFIKKEYQSKLELQTIDEKAIDEVAAKVGEEAAKRVRQTIAGNNPFIDTIEYASGEKIQLVASGASITMGPNFNFNLEPLKENEVWTASRIVTEDSEGTFGRDLFRSNHRAGNDSFAITKPNGVNEWYHLHSERFKHKELPDVPRDTILVEIMEKLTEENVKELLIGRLSK